MHSTQRYALSDLRVNTPGIERILGYKPGEKEPFVSMLIDTIMEEAADICDIRAEYRIFNKPVFDAGGRSLTILNEKFELKKIVFGQLRRSDSLIVFLCTAGEGLGRLSSEAMAAGDVLRAYICDLAGSEIAEAAADRMQADLGMKMKDEGCSITNRYSPGYCGWDVSEQHKLFRLMSDNFCGITLSGSALMRPEKSVSGFIGAGRKVKYNDYTCSLCEMNDCIYRRVKQEKEG
jgi:Vitamin B12 dependent methionine synthase, activation domain